MWNFVMIRKEDADFLKSRDKLGHPDFTQAITEHWSRGGIERNRLGYCVTVPLHHDATLAQNPAGGSSPNKMT